MADTWFTDSWTHLMGNTDALLADIRGNIGEFDDASAFQRLLQQAEQQRAAAEATLRTFGEQREALLRTLDQLQSELAVTGRPLRGKIS
jgi:hypothetical protein